MDGRSSAEQKSLRVILKASCEKNKKFNIIIWLWDRHNFQQRSIWFRKYWSEYIDDKQTSLMSPFMSPGAMFLMYLKTASGNAYSAFSGATSSFWKEKCEIYTSTGCMLALHKIGNLCQVTAQHEWILTISACAHVQYWIYRVLRGPLPPLLLRSTLVSWFPTKKLPSNLNLSFITLKRGSFMKHLRTLIEKHKQSPRSVIFK